MISGIPAHKGNNAGTEVERVYKNLSSIHSIKPHAVDAYVKMDGYIRAALRLRKIYTELLRLFLQEGSLGSSLQRLH